MPQLDLHGEDRIGARIKVKTFIEFLIPNEIKFFFNSALNLISNLGKLKITFLFTNLS